MITFSNRIIEEEMEEAEGNIDNLDSIENMDAPSPKLEMHPYGRVLQTTIIGVICYGNPNQSMMGHYKCQFFWL